MAQDEKGHYMECPICKGRFHSSHNLPKEQQDALHIMHSGTCQECAIYLDASKTPEDIVRELRNKRQ